MMRFAACLIFSLLCSVCGTAQAQPVSAPLVIGEAQRLYSNALQQQRTINIYLPADYATSMVKYPVLYLIDGGLDQDFLHISGTSALGALWARSQSVIVVGIATQDRRRELTAPTRDEALIKQYPTAGESQAFRTFIRDEVMPRINARFRTSGETAVMGESLAGLFIVETYLAEPDLFDHYAAISPSLWWDQQRLAKAAAAMLHAPARKPHRVYLSIANEGEEMQAGMDKIIEALAASQRERQEWCYAARPSLTHATIYHSTSPEVLQFLFPTPITPDPESGFTILCSRKS